MSYSSGRQFFRHEIPDKLFRFTRVLDGVLPRYGRKAKDGGIVEKRVEKAVGSEVRLTLGIYRRYPTRTPRCREQYTPLVALCLRHFLADSIICMCVFDFRQAQRPRANEAGEAWTNPVRLV